MLAAQEVQLVIVPPSGSKQNTVGDILPQLCDPHCALLSNKVCKLSAHSTNLPHHNKAVSRVTMVAMATCEREGAGGESDSRGMGSPSKVRVRRETVRKDGKSMSSF